MATLRPFRALRPPPSHALRVAAPPYDVVTTEEAREQASGNPESFLHVSRPEIDLPAGTDEHAPEVYAQGARALADLRRRGVLQEDAAPHFYLYAQRMGAHRQAGLVGVAPVAEYREGVIKKHENTRPDKEDDRTRHIDALSAHDEPVFLVYRKSRALDALVESVQRARPELELTTADGVEHRLFIVPEPNEIESLLRAVPVLYIADGHHRSAAAARVAELRKGKRGEHDAFLAVLFPHDQVQILPYNRVVRDRRGRSAEELLAELRKAMEVTAASAPQPDAPLSFGIYLGKRWWRARARPGSFDAKDPVASLDVSIAQQQILSRIFGVDDPRRDRDVDFVGGIRGAAELERRVDSGSWSMALHLFPTRVEQLMAVSDAGLLMPPKSTWFEPKLRSGLLLHPF
jgi:uncharacterized protein (DUF1015 family)